MVTEKTKQTKKKNHVLFIATTIVDIVSQKLHKFERKMFFFCFVLFLFLIRFHSMNPASPELELSTVSPIVNKTKQNDQWSEKTKQNKTKYTVHHYSHSRHSFSKIAQIQEKLFVFLFLFFF